MPQPKQQIKRSSNLWFKGWLGLSVGSYVILIILLVIADVWYVAHEIQKNGQVLELFKQESLWQSVRLSFLSCTISAIISLFVAVPIGYFLSRFRFFGKFLVDAILDIPVVLPPLVIGLSLLILFNKFPASLESWGWISIEQFLNTYLGVEITNTKFAVVVAQFTVAAAFAVRTMKATFDQIDFRCEDVAMSLGASRGRAFIDVVLPQAFKGVVASGTLAWARSLGEFGPILMFAGATRGKTEVLSTSVYLEINTGNLQGAVMISLLMIALALVTILTVRIFCEKGEVND